MKRNLGVLISIVFLCAFVCTSLFFVTTVEATEIPDDWVEVGDTWIYLDFPFDPPWTVRLDGYVVDPPDSTLAVFNGFVPGSKHNIYLSIGSPSVAYDSDYTTLSSKPCYSSLSFLFLVLLICLYLSTRLWVFVAPAAWLSVSFIYFAREFGYCWYFEVLGALCLVCIAVIGALILAKTRK